VSANGKVALYTLNLNSFSSSRYFMFTYDDDFIVSSDASFTMKINGTAVTDGQTFQLTPNSKTVNVSVVATESAATFGGFTCTQPGTCVAAEYYLGNYGNNESGTDQVVVTAVAPNRVTKLTKTITVTQPFIKRTILDYNANWGSEASNGRQEITSGSGLPSLGSKDGYHFNLWSDGVTANPRTDAYGKNVSVYPIFGINATAGGVAINYNQIRGGYVNSEDNDWNCNGVCREVPSGSDGPEVTAYPDDGMYFIRWSDGSTANPRKDLNVKAKIDVYPIFAPILVITANNVTGEVAAAVPSGTPSATILATVDIPMTTLKFDNAPSGAATVTVKPIANPAAAAATPFTAGAATKIVDINVTGITGPVTVCLDAGPTDSIFHFTGGAWVELSSRTYAAGQVCGVTTNFSPFAAAEAQAITVPVVTAESVARAAAEAARAAAEAARAAAEAAAAKREAEKQSARAEITNNLKTAQGLTVDSFVKAEIPGITASNIAAFQTELLALPEASRMDINQVLKVARKFEVVGNIASESVKNISPSLFVEIGLIPTASKNKVGLVTAVRKLPASARDTYAEIKSAIDAEAAAIKARKDRLAAIIARNKARS
jgi:hypothetical protein